MLIFRLSSWILRTVLYIQSCTCIEDHQIRTCDHISGQCHCLANFTGQSCEDYIDTTMPNRNIKTSIIVGSVLGSVAIVTLLMTGVIVMSVAIFFLKKHTKIRKENLRISPSQQFESTTDKVSLEPSAPPYKQSLDNATSPDAEMAASNLTSV